MNHLTLMCGRSKMFMTSNTITYSHFVLLVLELKPNFTNNYFINNIINQVIDQFYLY